MHSGSDREATLSVQSLAKNEKSQVLLSGFEHENTGCQIIKREPPLGTIFLREVPGSNLTRAATMRGLFA